MPAGNQKNHGNNEPDYYSIIAGRIVADPGFLNLLLGSHPNAALGAALTAAGITNPPTSLINDLLVELDAFIADPNNGTTSISPRSQDYLADKSIVQPAMI